MPNNNDTSNTGGKTKHGILQTTEPFLFITPKPEEEKSSLASHTQNNKPKKEKNPLDPEEIERNARLKFDIT